MLRKATVGNSFSFSLKKVRATYEGIAQNFFQCKSCLFAEVSNRSHAGKAVANLNNINYNYNLSKLSATFTTGKVLKKRKAKEEGTYQLSEDEIVFNTSNNKYSVRYQLNGEFLLLTQFGDDSLRTRPFTIKFKRAR